MSHTVPNHSFADIGPMRGVACFVTLWKLGLLLIGYRDASNVLFDLNDVDTPVGKSVVMSDLGTSYRCLSRCAFALDEISSCLERVGASAADMPGIKDIVFAATGRGSLDVLAIPSLKSLCTMKHVSGIEDLVCGKQPHVVVAVDERREICFWDWSTQSALLVVKPHIDPVKSLVWLQHLGEDVLVTASWDKTVKVL